MEDTKNITLVVTQDSHAPMTIKIKRNTPLKKLMDAYCDRKNMCLGMTRFLYDGERLSPNDTAMSRNLQDGDEIDVESSQDGGSY